MGKVTTTSEYTHGVVSDTEVIYRRGTARMTRVPLAPAGSAMMPELATLLTIAEQHKLHCLWVCPGTHLSKNATCGYVEAVKSIGYEHSEVRHRAETRGGIEHVMDAHVWRKEGTHAERRSVYVNFAEWDLWDWQETDALSLLAGIHYVERALGVDISQGPAMAGRALMQRIHSKHASHAEWLRQPEIDFSQVPYSNAGKDCAFKAGNIEYKPGLYVHAYDKNSMYLGAIRGAVLGAGTPAYYAAESKPQPNLKLPGLWHCKIDTNGSKYNGVDMPGAIHRRQEWLTTPLLKLCMDLGYSVQVIEGYEWTEYHRTLETWGTLLWDVRSTIKEDSATYPHERGRILAYESVKRIATAGLGLLNSQSSAKYAAEWYRPDFWATVVEIAKERMIRNVLTIEQKHGLAPVACAVDCLYYISPDSNPYTAIPGMTDRPDSLGGYKVKHSLPLTPELVRDMQAAKSAGSLAKAVRTHEEKNQKGTN